MSDGRGRRRTEDGGWENRVDVAVDRAVREMLDVEPPADLRARVMFQVEDLQCRGASRGAHTRVGGSRTAPALLWVAIGAVAAIFLAVRVSLTTRPPVAPTTEAQVQPSATPPTPGLTPETPGLKPRPTGEQASAGADRGFNRGAHSSPVVGRGFSPGVNPNAVVDAATLPPADNATTQIEPTWIEPLRSIAPIQVAPILQHSIAPDEIAMRPLTPLGNLQVAPLSPLERRN